MNHPQSDVRARCAKCDTTWSVATLPMLLDQAAALMLAARCPIGCTAKVYLDQSDRERAADAEGS